MASPRRGITPIGMSFLDVMFCGFGAVVLLVILINGKTLVQREGSLADLRGEVRILQGAVAASEQAIGTGRRELAEVDARYVAARAQTDATRERLALARQSMTASGAAGAGRRAQIAALKQELIRLEASVAELRRKQAQNAGGGKQVRSFAGEADRQYLTGLKVGGDHILILLDVSASMLDRTIVNVLRLRNMDEATRRAAGKWRHTLRATRWLVSNLPRASRFQIFTFNVAARPLLEGTAGQWLEASDRDAMSRIDAALDALVPGDGTSLQNAFSVIETLRPAPDNILLLTDGLPTQGSARPGRTTVSGDQRLRLFERAVSRLGRAIPVNTILFPMEGDPVAAAAYWRLATLTRGSFITPAQDWP